MDGKQTARTALTNDFPLENYSVASMPKPLADNQLNHAVDLAFRRPASDRAAKSVEKVPKLRKPPQEQTARIAIKNKGRILFINPSDVLTVVAQGNYVLLQREADSHRLRESISAMAEKLEPYGFVRIHRSALVNRSWVEEIRPYLAGGHLLRLRGGKELTVMRSYKKNLESLADLWLLK
ncbi:MAG: LytR/AlgR family response regulator transcription factor [Candidatus Acidiferrales bacterium]